MVTYVGFFTVPRSSSLSICSSNALVNTTSWKKILHLENKKIYNRCITLNAHVPSELPDFAIKVDKNTLFAIFGYFKIENLENGACKKEGIQIKIRDSTTFKQKKTKM